jgi:uncharacterized protein
MVPARFGDLCVPAVFMVGRAECPSSAMPRPNSALEPTPPPVVCEHLFFYMAVPFYRGAFGGAAKRHRWAALTSTPVPGNRTESRTSFTNLQHRTSFTNLNAVAARLTRIVGPRIKSLPSSRFPLGRLCYTTAMDFEWDNRKAASNLTKHGVSFSEAVSAFYDPLAVTFSDPDHSATEDRWIILGTSVSSRLLFVAHTDRGDRIRIISARTVKPKERRLYESGDPDPT